MTSDAPRPPLLSVQALAFSRNEEPVFGPLAFQLDAGEALLVQGGNGAGKTTLLRVLAGLLRADAGTIALEGRRADAHARSLAMAYLGHLPALKGDLGALENLEFLCGLHGRRATLTPAQAMAATGLAGYEDTLARQLSAGQKKRLSLARLWLSPAPLWLLDEPYANLDLDGITLVNRMISAHLAQGGAALVTTHGAYAAPPVRTRQLLLAGREQVARVSSPTLPGTAAALLRRDLRLLWRRRGDALQPALFALLVVVLFALALGANPQLLARVAAAVLWLAALLAGLLTLDSLFRGDAEDGSLEQWILAPVPLAWLVAVRVLAHWLATAGPVLIATPAAGRTAVPAAPAAAGADGLAGPGHAAAEPARCGGGRADRGHAPGRGAAGPAGAAAVRAGAGVRRRRGGPGRRGAGPRLRPADARGRPGAGHRAGAAGGGRGAAHRHRVGRASTCPSAPHPPRRFPFRP